MLDTANPGDASLRHRSFASLRPLVLLFVVALAVRVIYVLLSSGLSPTPWSDSLDYDQLAWNLSRGLGFSLGDGANAYPTAFRPPLVPWLTSLLYHVAGHRYLAALLLQCVIGAVIPLQLVALGSAMFSGGVGRTAGWLAAFHPLLVFFSGYLLTETTFCVTLIAALLASVEWVKTPRPARALGVGMLWGVATLARPPALLLPGLVALWAWAPLGLTVRGGDRLRQIALLALGLALVVGPWTLRNTRVMHAFIPVTTGGGRALLDSNNDIVWNDPARRGGALSTYHIEPYASAFRGRTESDADAIAGRMAIEFLRHHTAEWPAMAGAKLSRFWRLTTEGGGTGAWQSDASPLSRLKRAIDPLLLWSLPFLPLALWGLVRALQGARRWFQSIPALIILYFMLNAMVYWGSLRTRVPIEPLVTLFAAVGFEDVLRKWRARRHGLRIVGRAARG